MRILNPALDITRLGYGDIEAEHKRAEVEELLAKAALVFANPLRGAQFGKFSLDNLSKRTDVHFVQPLSFAGFHPDCVYIGRQKTITRSSPVGDYNSSIAVYAFLQGATVQETLSLFNGSVYRDLGFFDVWEPNKRSLIEKAAQYGFDFSKRFEEWTSRGLFMHTINHPYVFVMQDVAKMMLEQAGLAYRDINATKFVTDRGPDDIVWPVYPDLAEHFGIDGEMAFKVSDRWAPAELRPMVLDLEEFVTESFKKYEEIAREDLVCRSIAMSHEESLEVVGNILTRYRQQAARAGTRGEGNPYSGIPDSQFWRKSVANPAPSDVDPVVSMPFVVEREDKVATAGSCFAQHIAARLSQRDFNYFVSERAPEGMDEAEARAKNYGTFSARYGNIYTTRQLVQLFDRAYGKFTPVDTSWRHPEGGFVDPFRPQIESEGYATEDDVAKAREEHFAAVRDLFEQSNLFVFTLGLTEAWRSKRDGAVFPLAPGVAGGSFDPDEYEFVNFTAEEVAKDLGEFIAKLRSVNSTCRVLLTVSPVPLIATFEPRHVLVSTTYSKSALRVAAEQVCAAYPDVHYFPSYEIITGAFNRGRYFDEDLRSVRPEGVDHVMRLFFKHLTKGEGAEAEQPSKSAAPKSADKFEARLNMLDQVVCDEEAIDR